MAQQLPVLVNLAANALPYTKGAVIRCDAGQVINDKKVTDHHAVIPTQSIRTADLSALPVGGTGHPGAGDAAAFVRRGPAL